jgi:N-acetylmuramoyl-L-alanine amidase
MRAKATLIQQILLGLALIAALCWNLAAAGEIKREIKRLQLSVGPAGTTAELHLPADATFKSFSLSGPDRLVIDLPDTRTAAGFALPAPIGLVRAVRTGHPVPGTTRIVFDLAAPVAVLKPRLEPGVDGARLVLEWPEDRAAALLNAGQPAKPAATSPAATATVNKPAPSTATATRPTTAQTMPAKPAGPQPTAPSAVTTTPASNNPATTTAAATATTPAAGASQPPSQPASTGATAVPVAGGATVAATAPATDPSAPAAAASDAGTAIKPAPTPLRTRGTRPLIVAIDAGHGGQDPGAIGPSGKREKDVTLAIARELARQVNATPGLKAVLIRDSDVFLPLTRRSQLARQAKADIFVSIHADAAENRNAKGSSVYVLSLRGASSQRARWLADKENAADLIGGASLPKADNTLTSVLLDLTQSGQMRASEDAANHVLSGLKKIGFNHKPQIERANFAVLRTSDMPSMLVETAFISNPDEEKRLVDPQFQRALARAVLDGIDTYFTRQPPPGTLYAARAAERQGAPAAGSAASATSVAASP